MATPCHPGRGSGRLGESRVTIDFVFYGSLIVLGVAQAAFPLQRYGLLKPSWKQDLLWVVGGEQVIPRLVAWLQFYPAEWLAARTPALVHFGRLPPLAQFGIALVLTDFTRYWLHRAFHVHPLLWDLHKAHHSSTELTAISGARGGYLESIVGECLTVAPLLLLGIRFDVYTGLMIFYGLQGMVLHSNLGIGSGLARIGLCTPAFHRWHHAKATLFRGGQNFGLVFRGWDVCFGTAHEPGTPPHALGFEGQEAFPSGYLGRLAYPLQKLWPGGSP